MRPSFRIAAALKYLFLACMLCSIASRSEAQYRYLDKPKSKLEIGAFNIQVFGESKISKPFIRQTLISILSRYDIAFIQEIRDDENLAIYQLLMELSLSTGKEYHALVSERLGRGDMKEQYAYFYDSALVEPLDSYVFDDKLDEFAREPFVGRFRGVGREFTLAGIHMAPNSVATELAALGKVHKDIKKRFGDSSMFIMGDFNADCIYYKPHVLGFDYFSEEPKILITDDMDTSVAPNSCAYDRILGFGEIQEHVSDVRTFNFMEEYSYDLATAKLISDHYPVEFTLDGYQSVDLSVNVCGVETYWTNAGYCYGVFAGGKKRVSEECCP